MHPSSSQACRGTRTRRIQSKFDAFALDRLPKQTWACYCAYKLQSEKCRQKLDSSTSKWTARLRFNFDKSWLRLLSESRSTSKISWHSGVCSSHQNGMYLTPSTAHFAAPQQSRSVVAVVELPTARSITKRHTGQPFTISSACPRLPLSDETKAYGKLTVKHTYSSIII